MSDRPHAGATITTGATAAVVAVVLGACLGWWAVRFVPPTTADVREAASSLVPPGFVVRSTSAGYLGDFPTRGPYGAGVEMGGGGTPDERVAALGQHAQARGWVLTQAENLANAVSVRYEREGLSARISARKSSPTSLIGVGRTTEPGLRRVLISSALGASAGIAIWLLLRLKLRYRRLT